MTEDKNIIETVNKILKNLPSNDQFDFYYEYEVVRNSIDLKNQNTQKENSVMYGYMEVIKNKVFDFMNIFNYLEKDGNKLTPEGREAKRLGHQEYQNRLIGFEEEKWYKSALAKKQYDDYPKLIFRSTAALIISAITLLLYLISRLLGWK